MSRVLPVRLAFMVCLALLLGGAVSDNAHAGKFKFLRLGKGIAEKIKTEVCPGVVGSGYEVYIYDTTYEFETYELWGFNADHTIWSGLGALSSHYRGGKRFTATVVYDFDPILFTSTTTTLHVTGVTPDCSGTSFEATGYLSDGSGSYRQVVITGYQYTGPSYSSSSSY